MKTNLLKAFALALLVPTLTNCSVEPMEQLNQENNSIIEIASQFDSDTPCIGLNPKARILNNSDHDVDFEIHDSTGNLIDAVYGLNPGELSDWKTFPVGITSFTVSTIQSFKIVTIDMGNCMAYDVTINENNQLNTDIPIQF